MRWAAEICAALSNRTMRSHCGLVQATIIISGLLLCGCTTRDHNLVEPVSGTRLTATNGVSIFAPSGWWLVHIATRRTIRLTADGLDIDEITLRTLHPGDLFYGSHEGPPGHAENETALTVHAAMSAEDIRDLQCEKLRRQGAQQARCDAPVPGTFGKDPGFRFDYSYSDANGLIRRGRIRGALRDGGLDLLLYEAPAQHYFALHEPEAERVAASLRTP